MNTLPLTFAARHMFVDTPEGRWLVDTGCPLSFGDSGVITWRGTDRRIPKSMGPVQVDDLRRHVDHHFVGLLGTDMMNEAEFCWDGPRGQWLWAPSAPPADSQAVEVESLHGIPVVRAVIAGRPARCIFDTGAQFGYFIDQALAADARPDGQLEDFHPTIGRIDSPAWQADVALGAITFTERIGQLTGPAAEVLRMGMAGIHAIIGCSWLPQRVVWYRMGKQLVVGG